MHPTETHSLRNDSVSHSTELHRQIEDLALQLVVAEAGNAAARSRWVPALESIRDRAAMDQASQVAAAATALIESLPAPEQAAANGVAIADVLQAGIVRLQQILDEEAREPDTGSSLSLAQDPELLGDFI